MFRARRRRETFSYTPANSTKLKGISGVSVALDAVKGSQNVRANDQGTVKFSRCRTDSYQ